MLQPFGWRGDLRIIEIDTPDILPLSGRYDLVVIAGYHETIAGNIGEANPLEHLLRRAYSILAPDGCVVVAGHNALALRHFNGQCDAYGREGVALVEGAFPNGSPKLWSTAAISQALANSGFQTIEPCALMGSVKQPRLLVSPRGCGLQGEYWNLETLVRRALVGNDPDRLARFSESRVLGEIVRGGALVDWSDGYLFLGRKSADSLFSLGRWLASSFSQADSGYGVDETRFVVEPGNDFENHHIRVESYSQNNIEPDSVAPYINGTVHLDRLDDLLQTPGWTFEQVMQWSAVWLRCLLASLGAGSELKCKGAYAAAYDGDYDLWVPDRLFLATPARWIRRPDSTFECLRQTTGSEATAPLATVLYVGLLRAFAALRSVAEPADTSWLDPVALAATLVSRLGYVLGEADHKALAAHWRHVTRTAFPSPEHFIVREKPRSLTDEAKLYWATESEGFSETKASTAPLALHGSPQVLRLPIGAPEQAITKLRFDVANRPGCFEIENMAVLQANGDILWRWDHKRAALSGEKGATLVVDHVAGRTCVLSRGNDPQFVLDMPEPALSAGGVLEVRLLAWPQRL
ncbi:hypothetical protein [Gilvimarinus xylanilyticus]|uniref:Uncharacterized protein n=1 Tax=Gilvimarinus xylanilyticus TaxID=2944139 RepID=A0A9X2KTV8_9GAMM|nr:hypothetical protein [Gilvimarinus xylanilyticus]MCP8900281.1 hypothetical protein [Gilvimarinus xylanilyticus]